MEKKISRSTISSHNAGLAQVFKTAEEAGIIERNQRPVFPNTGEKTKPRIGFTPDELNHLLSFMKIWCKTGHTQKTKDLRHLLRDYVYLLLENWCKTI